MPLVAVAGGGGGREAMLPNVVLVGVPVADNVGARDQTELESVPDAVAVFAAESRADVTPGVPLGVETNLGVEETDVP